MGKVRVFELSKQVNIPSKDLVDLLNKLGVPTANHMSAIDENAAKYVLRKYGPDAEKEKAAAAKQKAKQPAKAQASKQSTQPVVAKAQEQTQPVRPARPVIAQPAMQASPHKPLPGQAPRAAALQQAAQRLLQVQEEQKAMEMRLAAEKAEAERIAKLRAEAEAEELKKAEAARKAEEELEEKKMAAAAKETARKKKAEDKHRETDKSEVEEVKPVDKAASETPETREKALVADEPVTVLAHPEEPNRVEQVQQVQTEIVKPAVVAEQPSTPVVKPQLGAQVQQSAPRRPLNAGQGTGTATYRQPQGQGTGTATYRQPMGQGTGTATYRQPQGQGTGTATYRQPIGQGTGTATYRQPGTYAPRPQGAPGTFQRPGGAGTGYGPRPQGSTGSFGPRRPGAGAITVPPPSVDAPPSKGKGKSWGSTGKERRFTSEDDNLRGPVKGKASPLKRGKKGMAPDPVLDKRLRNIDVELLDEDGNVVRKSGRKRERPAKSKRIIIEPEMTVRDLALKMEVAPNDVVRKLFELGVMTTVNATIDSDTAQIVASEFNIDTELESEAEVRETTISKSADKPEDLVSRPPVVTVMGHVDHGKTSLLDAIRMTNVAAGEAGGITQNIGASQVELKGRKITFIDTPGHAAFTSMRARGAQVTDIVVLVVAADDGVMPQTKEAYSHAKAAGVPVIVAINKIDKPNAQPDRVLQELSELGLVADKWGGDTVTVEVSALLKKGINELLEMILLVADMRELKANPNRPAQGIVIESENKPGLGPVASVIIKNGTLKRGDYCLAGEVSGKVRLMINEKGEKLNSAPPSTAVMVVGLSAVPSGGDPFDVVTDEKEAKAVAQKRSDIKRSNELTKEKKAISLEDFFAQKAAGAIKDLNIILKADVQGSVEAVQKSLEELSNSEVRVVTVHSGVGAVSKNDVMLASTSDAIIIAFNVRPDSIAAKEAEEVGVDIRSYRIIYEAINDVALAMEGMLEPEYKEVSLGKAEVRAVFSVPKAGNIAGSYVTEGKITRNATARIVRDGKVVHEGKITSLRRFKDDAKEVTEGFECGIGFETFNDIKEGDIIEAYGQELVKRVIPVEQK